MGQCHGTVLTQQQRRHRLADDVGAAEHQRLEAGKIAQAVFKQHQAAERRARHQWRPGSGEAAAPQRPGVDRVEAVHVLGRVDGAEDRRRVDLRRQRQLHQDAVHRRVGVEALQQRQQLGLARFRRQPVLERAHAGLGGLPRLRADVDLAHRVVAHQHHRQAGGETGLRGEPRHHLGDPRAQPLGERLAVDPRRLSHGSRPAIVAIGREAHAGRRRRAPPCAWWRRRRRW